MVLHPKLGGVAIASLTAKGMPKNGFLDQQEVGSRADLIAERSANAQLIAIAPALFNAAMGTIAHFKETTPDVSQWPEPVLNLARAVAKAGGAEG